MTLPAATLRAFISYSHDSDAHRDNVLRLSERLRQGGIECIIDQYYEQSPPPQGWPRWMIDQIEDSDFVLVVCTDTYHQRFRGKASQGKGVKWEGLNITQEIYDSHSRNTKFIPVGFEPHGTNEPNIPHPLRGTNYYDVSTDAGFENLYRQITGQPSVVPGLIGSVQTMPPRPNP